MGNILKTPEQQAEMDVLMQCFAAMDEICASYRGDSPSLADGNCSECPIFNACVKHIGTDKETLSAFCADALEEMNK